jgi:hypothetical protein
MYPSPSILPWMTALSGVLVGIGQSPAASRICRRTYSFRCSHSGKDLGGVKGK